MLFSSFARPSIYLASLVMLLASCGSAVPPSSSDRAMPNDSVPTAERGAASPSETTATAPPGQVDPNRAGNPGDRENVTAAPQSVPYSADPSGTPSSSVADTDADADSLRVLSCQTSGGLVNDPDGPLNVRREPDTTTDNVVGTIDNGAPVSIVGDRDNWWQLDAPTAGWVSKNLIDSTCNEKVAQIEFSAGAGRVTFGDRFFGTGYHHYQLAGRAGQTLSLAATGESPLPFVLAPDERDLSDGAPNGTQRSWSGVLPEDGTYTLVFDSNFRGYTYEVTLEIR